MTANSDGERDRDQVRYADQQVFRAAGGETHQQADGTGTRLTTQQGAPVSDDQNTLRAGDGGRGAALLEDFHFREKITHFDHERIPERVVHARGTGAHGVFQSYGNAASLTRARFLAEEGRETPVFVRFSKIGRAHV